MKRKISFVLNIIIVLMVVVASIIMFTGFKFMHGPTPILESTKLGMFRFFTVDSNLFMGIVSLIFIIGMLKYKEIPKWMYILKFMGTCGVTLTFVVVFVYLGPIAKDGIISLLQNSSLFFHLLIPIVSIITFCFFENTKLLSFKESFYGLVPCLLYSLYYVTNILVHMENGKVSTKYDWYWFVQNGVWTAFIVAPLWRINKR